MSKIKTVDDLVEEIAAQEYISIDMRTDEKINTPEYYKFCGEIRAYKYALLKAKELKANAGEHNR